MTKRRTVWKKLGIGAAVVLGACAIPIGYALWWAYTAKPTPTMGMLTELRTLVASGPPTSVEAWRTIKRVGNRVDDLIESRETDGREMLLMDGLRGLLNGDPHRPEMASIHADLKLLETEGMLAALRSLADMPPPGPPIDPAEFAMKPEDTPLTGLVMQGFTTAKLQLLFISLIQMRLHAIDGEPDESLVWLRATVNIAEGKAAVPSMIGGLLGVSYLGSVTSEVVLLAREGLLPDEHVRRAMRIIQERPRLVTAKRCLEGERLYTLDWIYNSFAPGPVGGGWLVRSEGPGSSHEAIELEHLDFSGNSTREPHWTDNLRSLTLPTRQRSIEDAESLYRLFLHEAMIPPAQRPADPGRYRLASRGSPFLESLIRFPVSITQLDRTETYANGARLALAIELFRRSKGEPPQSLNELTPEFIDSIPTDGFARDGAFIYRLLEPGEDPEGRLFRLYSVGRNLTDDGGVENYDHDPMLDDVLFDQARPAATTAP